MLPSRVIEGAWLFAIVATALGFRGRELVAFFSQPKYFALHVAALVIITAWAIEWVLGRIELRPREPARSAFDRIDTWLGRTPSRWAVIAAALFGATVVVSTLLSPQPGVSLWGRGFDALGYDTYSVLTFLVIFGAIALRLRNKDQALRLAYVIVGTAVVSALYGVSQHFGWDPIGRGGDDQRVLSTFGNPLTLGSYLVMSIGVTAGVGLELRRRYGAKGGSLAVLALAVQLAAIWFAGSRGPWIGTIITLVFWLGILAVYLDRSLLKSAAQIVVSALVVALLIAILPGGNESARSFQDIFDAPTEVLDAVGYIAEGDDAGVLPRIAQPGDASAPTPEASRATPDIGVGVPNTGVVPAQFSPDSRSRALSGRADIWRSAIRVSVARDWVFAESGTVRALRHFFGFGPDMFFYVYPLEASPRDDLIGVAHAHNFPLHILVELGLVGILVFGSFTALVIITAVRFLRRKDAPTWQSILVISLLAAIVGRAVEQITGIARTGDLVLMWSLAALLIAIVEIRTSDSATDDASNSRSRPSRSVGRGRLMAPLAATLLVTVLAVGLIAYKDVPNLWAGRIAAEAFSLKADGEPDAAFLKFKDARDLAPDVERYSVELAAFLTRTATAQTELDDQIRLYQLAHDELSMYEDRDPLSTDTQLRLLSVTSALVDRGQRERVPELVIRAERIVALLPHMPRFQSEAAMILVRNGQFESALAAAERAILGEAKTRGFPDAWLVRAEVYLQRGDEAIAMSSLNEAIRKDPIGRTASLAHRALAALEDDPDRASLHTDRADLIDLAIKRGRTPDRLELN